MKAEIARLKQDLKKDKKFRTDLMGMNSKEWSVGETIHQRTEWLRSAGYQIDETEYTDMFVSDQRRGLCWRSVLVGMCCGMLGAMFARYGISVITAAGSGAGVYFVSMTLIAVFHFFVFSYNIYETEMSLKLRRRVLPAMVIAAVIGGFILGMILTNVILKVYEYTETGSITDKNWAYHFNEDKTVTLTKYLGKGEEVNVPEKYKNQMVVCIGARAFAFCDSVRSVKIPDSVTTIEEEAFSGCTGLTDIEIPDSVTTIEEKAFSGCTGLTDIEIPDSVTGIEDQTFSYCTELTDIVIPNSVTEIGESAFSDCTGLTDVEIPNSVTEIGKEAFFNCTGLTDVEIPNSVIEIGEGAFLNCIGLISIVLPESVTEIKDNTFGAFISWKSWEYSKLESIEIPGSVTSIGSGAFPHCIHLKKIMVSPENEKYETIDNVLFEKNAKSLICYPAGLEAEEYIIPDGVETIGDHAFADCGKLKSVRMPDSVRTIGNEAFYACSCLADIDMPQGVASIGEKAFSLCHDLTAIQIPESVETIGSGAFSFCDSLTHIEIPESVTTIDSSSLFYGCNELTDVRIPESMTEIGYAMFFNCSSLTSVRIPGSVVEIDRQAFNNCKQLSLVVEKDSFAEQYARDREIPFTYGD